MRKDARVHKATKAIVGGVIILVLATLLPGLVMSAIGWSAATGVAILGVMSSFIASVMSSWRVGLGLALPLAIASALAASVTHNPWLAALVMLVVAGSRGLLAMRGLHVALTTAVIAVGFVVAQPPASATSLPDSLFVGIVMLAFALYGAGIVALLSRRLPSLKPTPALVAPRAELFAVTSGILMAVATWFVIRLDLGHTGAWMLLTIVVVLQPYVQDGFHKALQRAGGTILGFAGAMIVGYLIHWTPLLYMLGMVAMGAALIMMMTKRPYWVYAAYLTAAIVLLEGASTSIEDTAEQRLAATLVGAAAALAVTLALQPWAKRVATKRGLTHY